jgi:hypothetical protein
MIGLAFVCLLHVGYAAANISAIEIANWVDDKSLHDAFDGAKRGDVIISNITPIKLTDGENAYLASASMNDGWTIGYVLARPKLKKAKVLKGYGRRDGNHIVNVGRYDNGSVLIIDAYGWGTGVYRASSAIVKFDGWGVSVLHSADSGYEMAMPTCGPDSCADDPGVCDSKNDVFLNRLDYAGPDANNVVSFVETSVTYDCKLKQSTVTSAEVLSFPVGNESEN